MHSRINTVEVYSLILFLFPPVKQNLLENVPVVPFLSLGLLDTIKGSKCSPTWLGQNQPRSVLRFRADFASGHMSTHRRDKIIYCFFFFFLFLSPSFRAFEHAPSNLSFTTNPPDLDVKNYKRTSLNMPAHYEPWHEPLARKSVMATREFMEREPF